MTTTKQKFEPTFTRVAFTVAGWAEANRLGVVTVREHIAAGDLVASFPNSKAIITLENGLEWLRDSGNAGIGLEPRFGRTAFTVKEWADLCSVSETTIRDHIEAHNLVPFRPRPRKTLIPLDEGLRWLRTLPTDRVLAGAA